MKKCKARMAAFYINENNGLIHVRRQCLNDGKNKCVQSSYLVPNFVIFLGSTRIHCKCLF